MDCPKCNGSDRVKSGKIKGRQRYKCISVQKNYCWIWIAVDRYGIGSIIDAPQK